MNVLWAFLFVLVVISCCVCCELLLFFIRATIRPLFPDTSSFRDIKGFLNQQKCQDSPFALYIHRSFRGCQSVPRRHPAPSVTFADQNLLTLVFSRFVVFWDLMCFGDLLFCLWF